MDGCTICCACLCEKSSLPRSFSVIHIIRSLCVWVPDAAQSRSSVWDAWNCRFNDFCIPLFNEQVSAVRNLDGLTVLWLGQLLDGRAYKELNTVNTNYRWLSKLKAMASHATPSSGFCIHKLLLQHALHICWAEKSKDVPDLLAPPNTLTPRRLLFPQISSCCHFSSLEVI